MNTVSLYMYKGTIDLDELIITFDWPYRQRTGHKHTQEIMMLRQNIKWSGGINRANTKSTAFEKYLKRSKYFYGHCRLTRGIRRSLFWLSAILRGGIFCHYAAPSGVFSSTAVESF